MFADASRYAHAGRYTIFLPDGSPVAVTRIPLPVEGATRGWHRRTDSERLDLLAFHYLGDATAAWALGWANGAVSLDALGAHELVAIPSGT
jgi:hypothetical protein